MPVMDYGEASKRVLEETTKRGPMCPLDVPKEVWNAVAEEYNEKTFTGTDMWLPAPNYHAEYRDCRTAYLATLKLLEGQGRVIHTGQTEPLLIDERRTS
jgi:hypothetical protein